MRNEGPDGFLFVTKRTKCLDLPIFEGKIKVMIVI